GASRPRLVSVSGAPLTPHRAELASSGSTARSPAIFSQDPHHGHRGRIRGKRAARRGRRAIPSASDVRERIVEFAKGLLRLDGTQCKNEAERENDEPDPPHEHLVKDGWRESSRHPD